MILSPDILLLGLESQKILSQVITMRGSRGGQGSGPTPMENYKATGFLDKTGLYLLKYHIATKPVVTIWPESADDGPLLVIFGSSLPSSTNFLKTIVVTVSKSWNFLELLMYNAHELSQWNKIYGQVVLMFYQYILGWKFGWWSVFGSQCTLFLTVNRQCFCCYSVVVCFFSQYGLTTLGEKSLNIHVSGQWLNI